MFRLLQRFQHLLKQYGLMKALVKAKLAVID
jgi:hypothetical protein